jgi:tetratricopeptide (TPR) repeat protein
LRLGAVLERVVTDPFLFNQAIEALRAYSLVQRDPTTNTLSIHRLVQAVVKDALNNQEHHLWTKRTIELIDAALPEVEHKNWVFWERMLAQAMTCADLIAQNDPDLQEATHLLHQTGRYLRDRARYSEAQPLLECALDLSERHQGSEHLDTAREANGLAALYRAQGQYKLAEPLFQRALAIRKQHLGLHHPDTATTLNNLATLYDDQGQYDLAEPLFQRALTICEQHLGPHHPNTAQSLNNLASLYYAQGQYGLAKPLFQRTIAIYEQRFGPKHPETQLARDNYELLLRGLAEII